MFFKKKIHRDAFFYLSWGWHYNMNYLLNLNRNIEARDIIQKH